ncbi:prolipoprotein diacylglyceryl transferase [Flavobacterium branchiophilum NBRC 15030 = ATCC 35035]|uniref:Phosphatidylglycerol--prolipoprotein diacylglyceryl transferase n=1 Tax=Flavobacterium branchiophilum TaxID=55197 RepID=A0A543G7S9_9FLAO|nr:prolipoprotein diacylglyceryl transferase [Flavobacterium branchiophilum]OXA75964.1 prolipoprotein diacylglyceryl transferase [Flavobacterium branchiophilum NBRC 15030 = ATCC 35035]TQM42140.1 prolipoprotein diacylglyceryl transferase [Flavobacterium branchiophilum]GEM53913.1 prolipoprotein diacylglyceryl transferase [Flavobacterium branchiophilum NBRC 15030 = ATCC 35035]
MNIAFSIVWNPSEGIDLGFFMIRFYSLMFVVAFGLGWWIMKKIFDRENESIDKLDSLFVWTVVATLLGARLGHVIFYQPELFLDDPLSILLPIRTQPDFKFTGYAGLASHGAAISIIIMMYFFSKKIMKKSVLWVLDRVVIPVASGAIFVRLGNFFNSEIYGKPTDGNHFYAIKFVREEEFWQNHNLMEMTQAQSENEAYNVIANNSKFTEVLNEIPFRHPSQLYESFAYIFVFFILYFLYWKTDARKKEGFLFGMFLITLWPIRFVVEFVKASQGGFENTLGHFSTGQWLSIPFIILGLVYVFRNNTKKDEIY